jgi:hypothetical protein
MPSPVTPVVKGRPVQFVSVPEVGVPKIGVTKVGEVASALAPLPVEVVTPVPPFATGKVPVTPVVRGKPVQLVSVPEVGVPKTGVTKVGEVASALAPLPVEVVTPVPPFATGRVPVTPVVKGKPVQLVSVPEVGVPKIGVTKVGEVAKTSAPDPVSPVTAAARFALEGVARKVATPVPSPETPVDIGKPVQFVSVPEVGVPKIGVTKVGEVASALAPLPVEVVTPVPPFATSRVPVTPVVKGRPVQFVSVPEVGVPRIGVTKVGEVASALAPLPVEVVTPVPPFATGRVPET